MVAKCQLLEDSVWALIYMENHQREGKEEENIWVRVQRKKQSLVTEQGLVEMAKWDGEHDAISFIQITMER